MTMAERIADRPIDYSLYLVTGRELLSPGKVGLLRIYIVPLTQITSEAQDYLECLEQVGSQHTTC